MTNKTIGGRSGKQEPGKVHVDAIMEHYGVREEDLTEDGWDEHDKVVRRKLDAEEARSQAQALQARGKKIVACGAPQALVELMTSGAVKKDSEVMGKLDDWHKDGNRICVLSGPVGVGKTVAAVRWLMNHGRVYPCFVRAGDFEARGRYSHVWRDAWQSATGMVLDDMGAEYQDAKGNLLADLDTLIDTYAVGGGRLIITTNLPWDSDDPEAVTFQSRYEERISSRIVGSAAWVNVAGQDLRRLRLVP